jgi:general nucleoside transport system permease protein
MSFWVSVLEASVRLGVPLLLVALGELIAERSGIINIGLEGMMSAGAYVGFVVMATINSAQLAIPAAMLAGAVVASVMAGVAIWGRVNQILTGFALFVMVPAATAFLYQQNASALVVTPALPVLSVPILSDLPIIGRVFFSQNEFYYVAGALCLVIWAFFNRTLLGLQVTACGHDPEVASLKGVAVLWIRTAATLACGAMAGLAGAALTVGALGQFRPGVTGGLGFIAIAVVILGRWRVQGVVVAAFAIGFADALRLRLGSQLNFPVQLLAMLPWIVVLVMLIAGARFANVPRALGRTFGSATAMRST